MKPIPKTLGLHIIYHCTTFLLYRYMYRGTKLHLILTAAAWKGVSSGSGRASSSSSSSGAACAAFLLEKRVGDTKSDRPFFRVGGVPTSSARSTAASSRGSSAAASSPSSSCTAMASGGGIWLARALGTHPLSRQSLT